MAINNRSDFEYLVYHSGSRYEALNGQSGRILTTTSTKDVGAVINAAINSLPNGGKIVLAGGMTFLLRTKIIPKNKIHLKGAGESTIIKQDSGANQTAIIESAGFSTLTGKGSNGGPHSVYLSDFVIEGNKSANTGTATVGIRYYGYNWHLSNIHIRDCKGRGMYSEWCDNPAAPNAITSMESYYSYIKIHHCDGDGWLNRGPHDWEGEHITIYDNGGNGYVQEYAAGLYDGGGFVETLHCYANDGVYGILLKGGSLHANRITGESCANALGGAGGIGICIQGGNIDCSDAWVFNQDKGIVFHSGGRCQVRGLRAEHNRVVGAEILMNDVSVAGIVSNNNTAGTTSGGKGIKIGASGAPVVLVDISGVVTGNKTANIDWADPGNSGIRVNLNCYTDSKYPTVITGNPNTATNHIRILNVANGVSRETRFNQ